MSAVPGGRTWQLADVRGVQAPPERRSPRDRDRPGAWRVSNELAGGVAQAQDTIHRATQDIGEALRSQAGDGSEVPHDITFLTRPRSYLVVGQLDQLLGEEGGPHTEKIRSFESFRRSISDPEIVTFDELLARAEWVVDLAEG